jgi:hypothetical protein
VVVADGEGDRVGGWWLESHSPAHQVLGEGVLGVGAEVKTASTRAAAVGPCASASSAGRSGISVVGAVVGGRHCRW